MSYDCGTTVTHCPTPHEQRKSHSSLRNKTPGVAYSLKGKVANLSERIKQVLHAEVHRPDDFNELHSIGIDFVCECDTCGIA